MPLVAPNLHARTIWLRKLIALTKTVVKLTRIDEPSMSIFSKQATGIGRFFHATKHIPGNALLVHADACIDRVACRSFLNHEAVTADTLPNGSIVK
jgi:hypothetical protein